jgi:hypothetical protein
LGLIGLDWGMGDFGCKWLMDRHLRQFFSKMRKMREKATGAGHPMYTELV